MVHTPRRGGGQFASEAPGAHRLGAGSAAQYLILMHRRAGNITLVTAEQL